jgi:DNA-binding NtrC family response regulator
MGNRILIVDDDRDVIEILTRRLRSAGYGDIAAADHPLEAAALFDAGATFDLALIDVTMPEMDGLELLEIIKNTSPSTECVMVTAVNDIRVSVKCLKKGAYDYLVKPVGEDELLMTVNRALERKRLLDILDMERREAPPEIQHREAFTEIVTQSPRMVKVLREAELHAASHFPVLITGESGTGKELLARAIHAASPRAAAPFTAVNMASLNSGLFDAEFFGHTRGAFTGADSDRTGYLETTHDGTLFLDEIGILPMELQGKLLRVLQNGEFIKLGTSTPRRADVRVIAATNEDLDDLIAHRMFRKDLYYRIRGAWLHLPPLRERTDDIPLLIREFVQRSGGNPDRIRLADEALERLMGHDYPGNVRELESIIRSAVTLSQGSPIALAHLPKDLRIRAAASVTALRTPPGEVISLAEAERHHILKIFALSERNKTQAAKLLGIGLNTLRRKLKAYGEDADNP